MPVAKMTTKGQTVIPKEVRDHLGVKPGDKIDFIVKGDGEVVVRPLNLDVRRLYGILHKPGRKPVSVREMNEAIREGASARP